MLPRRSAQLMETYGWKFNSWYDNGTLSASFRYCPAVLRYSVLSEVMNPNLFLNVHFHEAHLLSIVHL